MNTMKDYHALYLQADALRLICMFQALRKEPINSFELDSAHYVSTLAIVKLQFVESTIRSSIPMICKGS